MSSLPKQVSIREVGPREGFQFEPRVVPTAEKLRLIRALVDCGLKEIEVTSFVRPDRVPQMADAEAVVEALPVRPEVRYYGIYLNLKGFERAQATGRLTVDPGLSVAASDTFSRRNANVGVEEGLERQRARAERYRALGATAVWLGVSAAFGCNYEGDVPAERVLELLARLAEVAGTQGLGLSQIRLMDTMGWANPRQVRAMVSAVRQRWPEVPIALHLHDTRGLGLANAYAALLEGVDRFDAAVGGLGGCPFAEHRGSAGNIATEDFVLLCEEMGIATGVDLDQLIAAAELAEEIVGHPLPGKVKTGGNLARYRARAKAGIQG
jgi:hydroxymethylglutaryl-CoA lyase